MNRVFVSMVAYSLLASASLATLARAQELNPQPLPPGPDPRVQITEACARLVARDAFMWAWPLVNVYNRRLTFKDLPEAGLMGGIVPVGPPNRLAMLTDYVQPEERLVACPIRTSCTALAFLHSIKALW